MSSFDTEGQKNSGLRGLAGSIEIVDELGNMPTIDSKLVDGEAAKKLAERNNQAVEDTIKSVDPLLVRQVKAVKNLGATPDEVRQALGLPPIAERNKK